MQHISPVLSLAEKKLKNWKKNFQQKKPKKMSQKKIKKKKLGKKKFGLKKNLGKKQILDKKKNIA